MQAAVNTAPTAAEGRRVRATISALATAGITGGYLASPRLKEVHWQARGRQTSPPRAVLAGESARVVTVDRKVVEVRGHLFLEAPKNRKWRRTIYPRATPGGWPLAEMAATRIKEVKQEQSAGRNPLGLMFPAPKGGYWRSSNFSRRVLKAAYLAADWRGIDETRSWTWHSLRHVFCTTALNIWHMDVADVSRLAGHSNVRITLEMYVGTTTGTLARARAATD